MASLGHVFCNEATAAQLRSRFYAELAGLDPAMGSKRSDSVRAPSAPGGTPP
eukprot:SAG11_NODE_7954_length_1078_cov_0.822268_3_plen_51_part_01